MGRVVAEAVVAGDADGSWCRAIGCVTPSSNWFSLIARTGGNGRSNLGNQARQARTARQHVFDRRRNEEVVVRPEQHRPGWKTVGGVHPRADVRLRNRQAVPVEPQAQIDA